MTERVLGFEGAVNFRDIGGYPAAGGRQTRWRRIYRADSLAELTPADQARLAALELYGLSDFRLPKERESKPDRLPDGHGIQVLTPGFIPRGTEDMLRRVSAGEMGAEAIREEVHNHYRLFATEHLGDYVSTFRMVLAAAGRPVLLHCTSGKDRTGFGIALLMLAAGCDDETVVADYTLTNAYRRDIAFMFRRTVDPEAIAMLTSAQESYMRTALDTLHRVQGPPESWLGAMGFDAAERTRLHDLLSEPVRG